MNDKQAPCILLVDDDRVSICHLQAILEHAGYHCIYARTAREALDALTYHHIDIGIFDLIMPETDGIELFHCCQQQQNQLIGVLYSAYLSKKVRSDAKGKGINACLAKPTPSAVLLELIGNILSESSVA
ncbi:MAG: response regulator [Planctomycetes bacterium]|nr:response regulator [Planctomycetota bacterium]